MTEKTTKTLIGAFVVGALALLIAGIMLVGSGKLFSHNLQFVLYFDGSLRGLVNGSPVYFKGVRVGRVTSIHLTSDPEDRVFRTPVIIELDRGSISSERPGKNDDDDDNNFMGNEKVVNHLIQQGLRGRLGMLSFVTGQLSVDLELLRDADPVDTSTLHRYRGLQQIPTVPTTLDALFDVLSRVPFEEIAQDIQIAMRALSHQIAEMDISSLVASITALGDELQVEVHKWGEMRESARTFMGAYTTLAENADASLGKTLEQVDKALRDIRSLAASAGGTLNYASGLLREDSPLLLELSQTLTSVREASQAISDLATLLDTQPESLIFGRGR